MRIALAGTGRLGGELFKAIVASRHEIVALIQDGRRTQGWRRGFYTRLSRVLARRTTTLGLAQQHGVPILWIDKMTDEELAPLRALEPDLLLVGGFGIILKPPLLRLPRIGCLNTHSSLLPRHRGPNPFTAVILAGDDKTGVTFHAMDEGIDTGDIIEQYTLDVGPSDTAGTIYRATSELAGRKIAEVLDRVEQQGLKGAPQNPEAATYDQKLKSEETWIRWDQPAVEIDRLARACTPFTLARFRRGNSTVYVFRGKYDPAPVDAPPGTVLKDRPFVSIATGLGVYTVLSAYTLVPVPWYWPAPWTRPAVGERLE